MSDTAENSDAVVDKEASHATVSASDEKMSHATVSASDEKMAASESAWKSLVNRERQCLEMWKNDKTVN